MTMFTAKDSKGDHIMKKATYFIPIFLFTLSFYLMTQDCFATQWAKTYGGVNHDGWSVANGSPRTSVQQTIDRGYIVSSTTSSFGAGDEDVWVLKLESDGTIAWQKTYGGTGDDRANAIQQTVDGGYIVAGWTTNFGATNYDVWILKLDSGGAVTWQKRIGGFSDDQAYFIQQTSEGGYIVAGWTGSHGLGSIDIWIAKLNSNGTITWQKTYGGSVFDRANFIQQTSDL